MERLHDLSHTVDLEQQPRSGSGSGTGWPDRYHRSARPRGTLQWSGCMHGRHRVIVCGNCSCKWIASVIRGPTACPTRSYQTRRCLGCRLDRKVRRWRPGLGDATRGAVSWAVSTAPSSVTSQIKHMETRRSQVEGFEIGVED